MQDNPVSVKNTGIKGGPAVLSFVLVQNIICFFGDDEDMKQFIHVNCDGKNERECDLRSYIIFHLLA